MTPVDPSPPNMEFSIVFFIFFLTLPLLKNNNFYSDFMN